MRRSLQLLLALLAAALLVAPVAAAKHAVPSGNAVLADCDQHGALTTQYTHAQLSQALAVMPTWMKQYTSCQSVIENALANGGGVKANWHGEERWLVDFDGSDHRDRRRRAGDRGLRRTADPASTAPRRPPAPRPTHRRR